MSEIIPKEQLIKQLYKIINKDNNYSDTKLGVLVENFFLINSLVTFLLNSISL